MSKIKVYKTIIRYIVVTFAIETWILSQNNIGANEVRERKALRKIFGARLKTIGNGEYTKNLHKSIKTYFHPYF